MHSSLCHSTLLGQQNALDVLALLLCWHGCFDGRNVERGKIILSAFDERRQKVDCIGIVCSSSVSCLERTQKLFAPWLSIVDGCGSDRRSKGHALQRARYPTPLFLDIDA